MQRATAVRWAGWVTAAAVVVGGVMLWQRQTALVAGDVAWTATAEDLDLEGFGGLKFAARAGDAVALTGHGGTRVIDRSTGELLASPDVHEVLWLRPDGSGVGASRPAEDGVHTDEVALLGWDAGGRETVELLGSDIASIVAGGSSEDGGLAATSVATVGATDDVVAFSGCVHPPVQGSEAWFTPPGAWLVVVGLDARTGAEVWRTEGESLGPGECRIGTTRVPSVLSEYALGLVSTPDPADFRDRSGSVVVLDVDSGEVVLRREANEKPGLDHVGATVVVHDGREVVAYDIAADAELWRTAPCTDRVEFVHVGSGRVDVSCADGPQPALDVGTGETLVEEGLVLARYDRAILTTEGTPEVTAVDAVTGDPVWSRDFSVPDGWSPDLAANPSGELLTVSAREPQIGDRVADDRRLWALDVVTGEEVLATRGSVASTWSASAAAASPSPTSRTAACTPSSTTERRLSDD
ncbi:PQQ-binding-like beta-propeller repeat protein [Litorihabitans aurantiacus]|uniref:Pyrrolo-quinoline quinone repeat domain-containing protein n=1 Tax=Litorihabitans aurantiacus TaxID=1930061 RepID=A0AA37UQ35_9MICO|nr:PQQ-binding-like beta-propeller repeat protein [Litorihabitans aurantiacus]GMA30743.1 hypothetical protein GCM10025875_07350 [Litorihabitans aurantiacus]